ncbi:HPF/RaiA family ribosome-associated protein [Albimonas pacifica]|uniref:Cold-shock DNA-binding protein family n=1 Tax=Albimonas pacifica TaxID=1114924 RepID=A0A1I3IYK3_9RHOB|nr:HPF/RaiA family ribosome-associated protein [Albimonas pacifica]SFI52980.1 cold-shock DNA-binding protein family [Albimonas pacifica]
MQTHPVIAWRNLDASPAVQALIDRRIAALERISDRIVGCELTLEAAQHRRRHGNEVKVRLTLRMPGPDLTFEREVAHGDLQEDVILAVDQAFGAAETRLKKRRQVMGRVEVKDHPSVHHGEVMVLARELDHGFIRSDDGREVYFEREDLSPQDWERLTEGARLRFRIRDHDAGPYAAAVTIVD